MAKKPDMKHPDVRSLADRMIEALKKDEADEGFDLTAGLFGPAFSALVAELGTPKYANDRAHALALFRRWARLEVLFKGPLETHRALASAMHALLEEFRVEFDVPGIRYWEHPESDCFLTTMPGDDIETIANECVELARHEYLSRQGLHFGYEERL